LLLVLVGAAGSVPIQSVFIMLSVTVVAPVMVGQVSLAVELKIVFVGTCL
jgi:hypothetical protein